MREVRVPREPAVVVGGRWRCPVCGCAGLHGCSGPSRAWQAEMIGEILKLRDALAMIEELPASAADLQQIAHDALKVDPK